MYCTTTEPSNKLIFHDKRMDLEQQSEYRIRLYLFSQKISSLSPFFSQSKRLLTHCFPCQKDGLNPQCDYRTPTQLHFSWQKCWLNSRCEYLNSNIFSSIRQLWSVHRVDRTNYFNTHHPTSWMFWALFWSIIELCKYWGTHRVVYSEN